MLFLAVVIAIALGLAKTELQRRDPPAYAQKPEHMYAGFVSIDGYSHRAAAMAAAIRGEAPDDATRLDRPAADLHPTAVVVPFLTAVLSLATGSVPRAFQALSLGALIAQLILVSWLARTIKSEMRGTDRIGGWDAGLLAATLLAGHTLISRTAGQLQLDPFCAALGLLLVCISWQWVRARTFFWWAATTLTMLLGVFTKISYLPFLAVPALAALCLCQPPRLRLVGLALGSSSAVFATAWLFTQFVPGRASIGVDMAHLAGSWNLTQRQLTAFGIEMVLLLQAFPLAVYFAWPRPRSGGRQSPQTRLGFMVLGLAALVLLSTWAFHLPAIGRLYLPVLPLLLAPLAAWAAAWSLRPIQWVTALAMYVAANAAVSLYALLR